MINNFEQLPFVYQLESLIHVKHLGSAGIQPPYDYQTLEDGLKKQALRIWNEGKFDEQEIIKQLVPNNNKITTIKPALESLLSYRKTEDFGEGVDHYYRWNAKKLMNKVHQKEQESNKKLLEENTKLRRALMRVKAISENALISQELELSELLSEEKETDSWILVKKE